MAISKVVVFAHGLILMPSEVASRLQRFNPKQLQDGYYKLDGFTYDDIKKAAGGYPVEWPQRIAERESQSR
jgi:hypothetical protein